MKYAVIVLLLLTGCTTKQTPRVNDMNWRKEKGISRCDKEKTTVGDFTYTRCYDKEGNET